MLIPILLVAGSSYMLAQPVRNAQSIAELIENAELIGGNKYVSDMARSKLNDLIQGTDFDIPSCTLSYTSEIRSRTWADLILLRQPIVIEYTANPVPPAYQGPITCHRVTFFARMSGLEPVKHESKVLYEYFE